MGRSIQRDSTASYRSRSREPGDHRNYVILSSLWLPVPCSHSWPREGHYVLLGKWQLWLCFDFLALRHGIPPNIHMDWSFLCAILPTTLKASTCRYSHLPPLYCIPCRPFASRHMLRHQSTRSGLLGTNTTCDKINHPIKQPTT
jgi:hypothetical protein